MATIRRLSDEDVKAVFDCVHNNRPPPADLPFHLVNVGPNGLKLSPPSYEFEGAISLSSLLRNIGNQYRALSYWHHVLIYF